MTSAFQIKLNNCALFHLTEYIILFEIAHIYDIGLCSDTFANIVPNPAPVI